MTPEDQPKPEMAQFYTLSADYGRNLQLGGRSFKVGTEPSKPIRLTATEVAQAAGAGVIAEPVEVTTESRLPEGEATPPKVLPLSGEAKERKILDPSFGRGTRPGPFIPPREPAAPEHDEITIDLPAEEK